MSEGEVQVDYNACHRILGVPPGATLREIHTAYKRLALKHHPDRAPDDPESHAIFIRVTEAYSILKNAYYESRAGNGRSRVRRFRVCPKCKRIAELLRSLDGGRYCVDCLLNRRRKFLPLPVMIVIRCVGVMILLGAAALLIAQATATGDKRLYLLAGALGLAAMAVMGFHVYSADLIE